ncbi:hypothetical protein [Mumia zhuanghuii]|uniref:Uncharacterized protein n=1 Tax=Mumia zhuanghuii TaxID=2585211 RepID=A0A5C4MBQ8_9ACTN|nr:hypothetical protein [Mumia zhuanghuii]TNC34223.1 hypothetical protein FHE65_28085 [Mumia zhuanghuii]TNC40332.1 hypothetical protein FHE65_23220 [Mumia zhuanghuii]
MQSSRERAGRAIPLLLATLAVLVAAFGVWTMALVLSYLVGWSPLVAGALLALAVVVGAALLRVRTRRRVAAR